MLKLKEKILISDLLLVLLFLPVVHAASQQTHVISEGNQYLAMASYDIYSGQFSTDAKKGRVLQALTGPDSSLVTTEVYADYQCDEGTMYVNIHLQTKEASVSDVVTQAYVNRESITFISPPADVQDDSSVSWLEEGLAPHTFRSYSFTTLVGAHGTHVSIAVSYTDATGERTTHQLSAQAVGVCEPPSSPQPTRQPSQTIEPSALPSPTLQPLPDKIPAIICHPAEPGCQQSVPDLGINFENAFQNPGLVPQICSPLDTEGCAPNLPSLGLKFAEAYADMKPGECRVLEDDIVSDPAFHDALLRDGDPASGFLFPIYESTQDFERFVHRNALEKLKLQVKARRKLWEIHTDYWKRHEELVARVLDGQLSGREANVQMILLLQAWQREIDRPQQSFQQAYEGLQRQEKERFDGLAERAVERAKAVMEASCQTPNNDAGLAQLLVDTKRTWEAAIDSRTGLFDQTQQSYRLLVPVSALWFGELSGAFNDFDGGNATPLKRYFRKAPVESSRTFKEPFAESYEKHMEFDERLETEVRNGEPGVIRQYLPAIAGVTLRTWEQALDAPKTAATDCRKDKLLGENNKVEVTACETGVYPEFIIQGAPVPAKARLGDDLIGPPDTTEITAQGDFTFIPEPLVAGIDCLRRPGDPYWAFDCSCKCGDVVMQDGVPKACEEVKEITRHDVYVGSKKECREEGDDHFEPIPKAPRTL